MPESKRKNRDAKRARTLKAKKKRTFFTSHRVAGLIILLAGLVLLTSLYLPRIYAALAPETRIDPVILKQGNFWLVIPKVRVDCPVMPDVTKECLRLGAGHYPSSGFPGQDKNVIIAGHNYDPSKWSPKSTFGLLFTLEKGDEILLAYRGRVYRYVVDRQESLDANSPQLYAQTKHEQLTLLTCKPYEYKTKRLKIIALPK